MGAWLALSTSDKIISMMLLCLGLAIILMTIGFFAKLFGMEKISKDGVQFTKEDKSKDDKKPTLLKHRFFQLMDTVRMNGYIMSDRPDSNKKIISIVFLQQCLFYTINKGMKEFFKKMEETQGETLYMLPSTILKLMNDYADKARTINVVLCDGTIIHGIPDCFISRFNEWNHEHHKVLMESIQDVISDAFYSDWYMKCVACLDYLYNCYALTVYDANRTLGQLNGNLEAEIELLRQMNQQVQSKRA